MTKSEAREWFKNRMDSGLMPGTREAYKAALSALTVEHNSPTMKQAKKAWQGHWVDCRDDREFCQCSECNYPVFKNWNKGDFCPNCGTPMTDKALRELLKRLEMLKDDKTDTPPPNEPLTLKEELPPMTNADRIRAMSDEEMAEFIGRIEIGDFGPLVYGKTFCDMCKGQYECDDCRLCWLQQPVEED